MADSKHTPVIRIGNSWKDTAQFWKNHYEESQDFALSQEQQIKDLQKRKTDPLTIQQERELRLSALSLTLQFRTTHSGNQSEESIVAGARLFEKFLRGE